MSPPTLVKGSTGLASGVLGIIGLRNIFAPAKPLSFLTGDDKLQKFMFGTNASSELSRGQLLTSNIMGHLLVILSVTKLATVFSGKEGTFLRRNLFMALGASQVFMGSFLLTRFDSDMKNAGGALKFMGALIAGDGLILLYDAFQRPRKVKPVK